MKTKIRLEDISKTDPFRVPDNYFEQFNEEIMNRLPAIKTPEFRHVPLREKVKPWVYLAAMFVGLFFTIQFLTKMQVINLAGHLPHTIPKYNRQPSGPINIGRL